MSPSEVIGLLGGLGALGWVGTLIWNYSKRRGERAEKVAVRTEKIAELDGSFGLEAMRMAISETRGQINSLKDDVKELKEENKKLERQVDDLVRTVADYQRGVRVPLGMVLIPVGEIRRIRETYPGVLSERTYPGENDDQGYIDVRMRPLPPVP